MDGVVILNYYTSSNCHLCTRPSDLSPYNLLSILYVRDFELILQQPNRLVVLVLTHRNISLFVISFFTFNNPVN